MPHIHAIPLSRKIQFRFLAAAAIPALARSPGFVICPKAGSWHCFPRREISLGQPFHCSRCTGFYIILISYGRADFSDLAPLCHIFLLNLLSFPLPAFEPLPAAVPPRGRCTAAPNSPWQRGCISHAPCPHTAALSPSAHSGRCLQTSHIGRYNPAAALLNLRSAHRWGECAAK